MCVLTFSKFLSLLPLVILAITVVVWVIGGRLYSRYIILAKKEDEQNGEERWYEPEAIRIWTNRGKSSTPRPLVLIKRVSQNEELNKVIRKHNALVKLFRVLNFLILVCLFTFVITVIIKAKHLHN